MASPKGYEQLTVAGSSIGLASIPDTCNFVLISVEGAPVRFRDDGTAPTSSVGTLLNDGDRVEYADRPSALRFIRTTSTSATVNAAYYG